MILKRRTDMKLNISETIKKLRKEKDITQETLASALGVSCQSVSRWENGIAYPDIEMIPEIAAYFEISTDILFGTDEATERHKLEMANQILCSNDPAPERIEKMRAVMESIPFAWQAKYWMILLHKELGYQNAAENIEELRELAESVIKANPDWKTGIAGLMIQLEKSEDDCKRWIPYLGDECSVEVHQAFLRRYNYRNEIDKYNKSSQEMVVRQFDELFSYHLDKRELATYNPESIRQNRLVNLRLVDQLRDPSTDVDAWICKRAWLKMALSVALFGVDMIEEGYRVLDETIDLYETFVNLDDDTVLKYNCPVLDLIEIKKKELVNFARSRMDYSLKCMTENIGWGWEGFDKVREDERFITACERLRSLIPERRIEND